MNLIIALIFLLNQTSAQPENGITGRYTFDKGSTKNEADSTLQPKLTGCSFVPDRFGNERSAIYVHGNSGSCVNLGTSARLKPAQGSISLWVNFDLVAQKGSGYRFNPVILTKSHGGNDFYEGYSIGLSYSNMRIIAASSLDSSDQTDISSSEMIHMQQWYHVVFTYDDQYLTLYINNKQEGRVPKHFSSRFLAGDSVMIGSSANIKNERYMCGMVDDIRIYNRVISPQEVDELYHAPNPNKSQVYMSWGLRILAVLLVIAAIFWFVSRFYRQKLRKEREKNELLHRMNELETKAIRIQMNPHFMFNSLNTMQRFILEQDFTNAHQYLTRFSKLLRQLLESSSAEAIPLNEEISILQHYVELEKMRFENVFHFEISSSIPAPESVHIPFMLIQPFVENAIWHGLLPKKKDGMLRIRFQELDENRISCTVDDNGIGREQSRHSVHPLKNKSLGIGLIRQRLDLIEKTKKIRCSFDIADKYDARNQPLGTTVTIILPKIKPV